MQVLYHVFPFL